MTITINRQCLQLPLLIAASLLFAGCGSSSPAGNSSATSNSQPDTTAVTTSEPGASTSPQAQSLAAAQPSAQPSAQSTACPNGSIITAVTPSAGVARFGSVYSKTLYDPTITGNNTTDQPQKIQVQVTLNGQPQGGCAVTWTPNNGTASGWVFPDTADGDNYGNSRAWWTAGTASQQSVNVSITRVDGSTAQTTITGSAFPSLTRSNSIHATVSTPVWDQYSAEVTPLTTPPTTYFEAIGFANGYTGIQYIGNQQGLVLFSIWAVPVNGVLTNPTVMDAGISTCQSFGGEGTGIQCVSPYPTQAGVTYLFELQVATVVNSTGQDYTVYFTDKSTGVRQKLATLRMPVSQVNSGNDSFVEDWGTFTTSCLSNPQRAAQFTEQYLDHATQQWVTVASANGSAVYTPDHDEICSNYQFSYVNNTFQLSSGGMVVGTPLNLPGLASNVVPMPYVAPPPPQPFAPGINVLVNQGTADLALDKGPDLTPGATVDVYDESDGPHQQWNITEVTPGSGIYTFISQDSGLALDVAGSSTGNGASIDIATPDGSTSQEWTLIMISPGVYAIKNVNSGLVLDTQNALTANTTPVVTAPANQNASTQLWLFKHM